MRKILILVLVSLLLSACSFDINEVTALFATPSAAPMGISTETSIPSKTTTVTQTQPTPTYTLTPTAIGVLPGGESNPTVTPIGIYTIPTKTLIPTGIPTIVGTPVQGTGFTSIQISGPRMFWGVCKPNSIKFTVYVEDAINAYNVVLFVRLVDKLRDRSTDWNKGLSMDDQGNGIFTYTLSYKSIPSYKLFFNSWLYYQLVVTDYPGKIIGRTPVYENIISYQGCP